MAAQAGSNYDQNGIISLGRRLSRAYDQPIVQHTSKGAFVRPDVDRSTPESSSSGVAESLARFEAIGGVMAKVTLGFLTVMGAVVSLLGRASLEPVSQLFGFMVMLSATFLACTGSFFWWGGTGGLKVGINVKKVLHIYTLCVSSDVLARLISIFTAMPPSSILGDTGYFVSLSTLLLFAFSLLIHGDGLNAMFSQETVLFVVFTMVLNFSSTCLFCDILPYFLLPHLVYAGLLLGLSLSLVGYRLPKLTPSAIYKALNQEPPPHIVTPKRVSGDNSRPVSRRESYSSTVSSVKPASISSSVNSFYPQVGKGGESRGEWKEGQGGGEGWRDERGSGEGNGRRERGMERGEGIGEGNGRRERGTERWDRGMGGGREGRREERGWDRGMGGGREGRREERGWERGRE